jgi:hypothetical protein
VEALSKALTAKWFAARSESQKAKAKERRPKSEGQKAKAKKRNNAMRP